MTCQQTFTGIHQGVKAKVRHWSARGLSKTGRMWQSTGRSWQLPCGTTPLSSNCLNSCNSRLAGSREQITKGIVTQTPLPTGLYGGVSQMFPNLAFQDKATVTYGRSDRKRTVARTLQTSPRLGFYKLRPANKTDHLCQSWQYCHMFMKFRQSLT